MYSPVATVLEVFVQDWGLAGTLFCVWEPALIVPPSLALDPLPRSEEHTSELQSRCNLVCRLLLEKIKNRSVQHRYVAELYARLVHQHLLGDRSSRDRRRPYRIVDLQRFFLSHGAPRAWHLLS